MRVSAINNNLSYTLNTLMRNLSSGKKINSAADDAAGLAISQQMGAQISGLSQGTNNLRNMDTYVGTADGALQSVMSMVRDVSASHVRMNNGIYNDQDRSMLQMQIDHTVSALNGAVQQANFNGISVFSNDPVQAQYASGAGDAMSITIGDVSLDLSGTDATQDALKSLLTQIGSVGGAQNALEHRMSVNETSEIEAASSLSQLADADMAEMISEYTAKSTLQRLVFSMTQKKNEQESAALRFFA